MQRLLRYHSLASISLLLGAAISCQEGGAGDGSGGAAGAGALASDEGGSPEDDGGGGGSAAESGGAHGEGLAGAGGGASGGASTGGQGTGSGGAPVCVDGGQGSLGEPGADGFAVKLTMASELDENAPTTVAILEWALDQSCVHDAYVEFGLDDGYGMRAPVDLTKENRRTVLWGMKAERTYHYRIVATGADGTLSSDDYSLTTGRAPEVPSFSLTVSAPPSADQGFFVGTSWTIGSANPEDGIWTGFVLDTDGDLVWWHTYERATGSEDGYARLRLSADGQSLWFAQATNAGAPLYRVSVDTLDTDLYEEAIASHDICAVGGSTMAYLDYGSGDCARIVEIDETGTTKQVFDPTGVEGLEGCHANSVRYSASEDVYTYSARSHDVLVVGRDGQVKWRLSEQVTGGNGAWGGQQHGTHLLDESILILANYTDDMTAKAIEYSLDGEPLETFPTGNTGQDASFLGDVQRLPSGNTLITSGYETWIVTPQGEVTLSMSAGPWFGYMEFRTDLYGPADDIWQ